MSPTLRFLPLLLIVLFCHAAPPATAQTVIDLHTGQISGKKTTDYDVQAREKWQLEQDSLAYIDCLTRAFNFLHTDSLAQAQAQFERALSLRPKAPGNRVVHHYLARIFMARSQWKDALARLSRLLEQEPANADVRADRASCYLQLSRFADAVADFDCLLLLHPDDPHFLLLRATAHSGAHQPYDALDDLDTIVRLSPENAEAYLLRAEIYLDLGQRGYARRDAEKALQLGIQEADIEPLLKRLN